jgi:hypothetical protein
MVFRLDTGMSSYLSRNVPAFKGSHLLRCGNRAAARKFPAQIKHRENKMPRNRRDADTTISEGDGAEGVPAASLSNLTPETFQEHYRNIRKLKRVLDEANGEYRAARKAAESQGVDLKVLALLEQMAKLDEGEADARLTKLFKYAGWLDLPVGHQVSLFDREGEFFKPEAEDVHRQWAANEAGIAAAKFGGAVRRMGYRLPGIQEGRRAPGEDIGQAAGIERSDATRAAVSHG